MTSKETHEHQDNSQATGTPQPRLPVARVVALLVLGCSAVFVALLAQSSTQTTSPYLPLMISAFFIASGWIAVEVLLLRPIRQFRAAITALNEGRHDVASRLQTPLLPELRDTVAQLKSLSGAVGAREKTLQESEEHYRLIAESAQDIVYQASNGGRLLYLSPSVHTQLGYSAQSMLGAFLHDYAHPDDMDFIQRNLKDIPLTGTLELAPLRIRHALGYYLWFEITATVTFVERIQRYRVSGACRNVTARVEAEKALRSSEALYRLVVDNASDVIYQRTLEGIFTYVSPSVFEVMGYQAEELVGLSLSSLKHPDNLSHVDDNNNTLLSGQGRLTRSGQLRRKDGSYGWYELTARLTQDGDGRVVGVTGALRDIGDRKRAEIALRDRAEEFKILTENVSDIIARLDLAGNFSYVSPSVRTVLGYSPEELIGGRRLERTNDSPQGSAHERAIKGEGPITYQAKYSNKNGRGIWLESTINPVRDPATNQVIETLLISRDISQRKEIEARLQEAKEEAERASRIKSEFVATISHEIRTPMNGVIGMTALLGGTKLSEEQQTFVKAIARSAKSLMIIINDILDLSKLDVDKVELESLAFQPRSVVENCLSALGAEAIRKNIALTSDLDANCDRYLRGDPTRVLQILTNLVSNGIKFTDQGGVTVAARCALLDEDRMGIRFLVTDTGIGIEQDVQTLIFDKFRQADGSITRRFGGTGLGLTIAKRLVELMGGTISVESTPRHGSTFQFMLELPLARQPSTDSVQLPPGSTQPHRVSTRRPDARILVVEDNAVNRFLVESLLSKAGYKVDCALDGAQAVEAAKVSVYDLILMDAQMPRMDGMQATRCLRDLGAHHAHIPIIAISANAMLGARELYLAAGMNDYVAKPIDPDKFLITIADWLDRCTDITAEPTPAIVNTSDETAELFAAERIEELLSALPRQKVLGLVSAYLDATRLLHAEIIEAAAKKDFTEIARIAHDLRSTSAQLGANRLAEAAGKLEQAGLSSDLTTMAGILETLEDLIAATRGAFGQV